MADPKLAPTPVNVINPDVLSLLDNLFYRLPFPSLDDLEKLIKADNGESAMHEFRTGLRANLDEPRALKDFERGWERYWKETGSQSASQHEQPKSFQSRTKSPSPVPEGSGNSEGGSDGDSGADDDAAAANASQSVQ